MIKLSQWAGWLWQKYSCLFAD